MIDQDIPVREFIEPKQTKMTKSRSQQALKAADRLMALGKLYK